MFKKSVYLMMLLSMVLAACASPQSAPVLMSEEVTMDSQRQMEGGAPSAAPSADLAYNQSVANTTVDRLVIKNASLNIAVDDPEASMDRISTLAGDMGGYVVSANMYQTYLENGVKVPQASISIRVPAERLNETLTTIKAETAQPVISQNISSQDVTADYVDLESRLTNLMAAEEQLQQIMDSAVRTEDVLSVYSQLTSIREQIEVIKGQMKYYEDAAELSLISVELVANESVQPLTSGGWQPVGVAKSAIQALINTVKFLANAGIWIVILIIPVMLLVFGPPVLIIWAILRWRNKRIAARLPRPPVNV
jgi:hypothetical protein